MNNTKLIMIEGIPGSGKSTTAQHISRLLQLNGYSHKWWYEEEQGHPVYIFNDYESMRHIVDDLTNGRYLELIDRALTKWNEFVASVQLSPEIIILDSCLFGYLTWSLFPYEVPAPIIERYISEVERIIKPLNPSIIYLYQEDVGVTFHNICNSRGGETGQHFVHAATQSPYGLTRALQGFDGMVSYWKDYRQLTDKAYRELSVAKIAIDNSEGKREEYADLIASFLGFGISDRAEETQPPLVHFVGTYRSEEQDLDDDCTVRIGKDGHLVAEGLPQAWAHCLLIPRSSHEFDVQSLPFRVRFAQDHNGEVAMYLTGPALLAGPVEFKFIKREVPVEECG